MPNYVQNVLKMEGIAKLPLFTETTDASGSSCLAFDFNKIVPMPKELDITAGSIEDVAIEAAIRSDPTVVQRLKAVPHRMTGEEYARRKGSHPEKELVEMGQRYLYNLEHYGVTTWYDWCRKFWGTKWNAMECELGADTIRFQTAWSAPLPVIERLSQMYPDERIELQWADEDMGSNTGCYVKESGKPPVFTEHDYGSPKAYETYVSCWGESECLERDEKGEWRHKDCDACGRC